VSAPLNVPVNVCVRVVGFPGAAVAGPNVAAAAYVVTPAPTSISVRRSTDRPW
jgi:hypothetical protein